MIENMTYEHDTEETMIDYNKVYRESFHRDDCVFLGFSEKLYLDRERMMDEFDEDDEDSECFELPFPYVCKNPNSIWYNCLLINEGLECEGCCLRLKMSELEK